VCGRPVAILQYPIRPHKELALKIMSPGQLVCNVFKNERPSFDRYR
jgi:hypothetical protein